jgi:hypothetical protein
MTQEFKSRARIHNRAPTRFGVFFAVAGRLAEIPRRLAAHVLPALSRQPVCRRIRVV